MRILLFSSSARGHAIAETFSRSHHQPEIIAVSHARNPGIKKLASEQIVMDIMDFDSALGVGKKYRPDFVFIGPEDPIGGGLVNLMRGIGIPCIAPRSVLARIESSKGFTRQLMESYGIDASPKFRVFTSADAKDLNKYIEQDLGGEYVVKYDALKGGKGVKVGGEHIDTIEEGVRYAKECIEECGQVVVEEKLVGVEFSLISFASGKTVVDMPAIQDHKRAFDGDTGPNTGGMGSYSDANHSLPFLKDEELQRASEINRLTAEALFKECGEPYEGILYGGFIVTKDGVKVIEYNCRFGDPEALNILPLLKSDLVDICKAIIDDDLTEDMVEFEKKATVCKYIVPEGYPENKDQKGEVISFPELFPETPENARIYYGDISEDDDGTLRLGGSRTAGIVGISDTIEHAEKIAQGICEKVEGPVRFRSDIGEPELVQQRINTLKQIRSS